MEHVFALVEGEAHLMFLASPETVLAAGGGIGGGVATRFTLAEFSSFRSGLREDAGFSPPWLGGPHFAAEPSALRGLVA